MPLGCRGFSFSTTIETGPKLLKRDNNCLMTSAELARRSFASPFGFITFTSQFEKVVSVELCRKVNSIGDSKVLDDTQNQLELYLNGKLARFTIPLKVLGTAFQIAVWREISKVPFGESISYGEIAKNLGRPLAARAVGAAVGANPAPLLVGCHRVLGSNGAMTGYTGGKGLSTKKLLL